MLRLARGRARREAAAHAYELCTASFLVTETSKDYAASLLYLRRMPPHGVRAWADTAKRAVAACVLPCFLLALKCCALATDTGFPIVSAKLSNMLHYFSDTIGKPKRRQWRRGVEARAGEINRVASWGITTGTEAQGAHNALRAD
jgi:hypothetical protein